MSILDGMISSEAELQAATAMAATAMQDFLAKADLSERQRDVLALMQEGLSLADIFDIKKEHRDAMLIQGIRLLQHGEPAKARDLLVGLYEIEPMDERVIYALAATYQVEGDYATAGKLYVQHLALDATNPEGFLRLGECFLANQELDEAVDCFETVRGLVGEGHGTPDHIVHADKMLDIIKARRDGA